MVKSNLSVHSAF